MVEISKWNVIGIKGVHHFSYLRR